MSHILDTNIISELRKPQGRANAGLRAWISARAVSDLYLSVITVLEIEIGIGRIARHDSAQAERLQEWLDAEVLDIFSGRILPVEISVVRRCARMHVPDPRPERDALIAATASVHGMTVVTRNVRDFEPLGVPVFNPWS